MASSSESSGVPPPDPVWPPADWTDWPGTRLGGLLYDAVVLAVLIGAYFYWRSRIKKAEAEHGNQLNVSGTTAQSTPNTSLLTVPPPTNGGVVTGIPQTVAVPGRFEDNTTTVFKRYILKFRMFRIFLAGFEIVDILRGSAPIANSALVDGSSSSAATPPGSRPAYYLRTTRHRTGDHLGCCLCCCQCNQEFFEDEQCCNSLPVEAIEVCELISDTSLRRCGILTMTFFAACASGLFVHFIPCIWWTCDWGPSDGPGVRGALWFLVWGITCPLYIFLLATPALQISLRGGNQLFKIVGSSYEDLKKLQEEIVSLRDQLNPGFAKAHQSRIALAEANGGIPPLISNSQV